MSRTPFPFWATLVPILSALVLWAVTGSPLVLAFAALGPIAALASRWDARRAERRRLRSENADAARGAHERREAEKRASEEQRREAWNQIFPVQAVLAGNAPHARNRSTDLLVGSALGFPVTVEARSHIGVIGPPLLTAGISRCLAVQQANAGQGGTVTQSDTRSHLSECDVLVEVFNLREATVTRGPGAPEHCAPYFVAAHSADRWFRERGQCIRSNGGPLAVTIGRAETGIDHVLDLSSAPHAIVAGTTGSGKTELLRSWIVGMCATNSPAELAVVCIDFKGGTGFRELATLPHLVDVLTDLDDASAERVLRALRSELTRRERFLAAANVRAFEDLESGTLARLVVLVDEFQLLIERVGITTEVFADISARGRALGVHLILATQHPSRVVRDHISANCGLRVALRLLDQAESQSLIGSPIATTLNRPGMAVSRDDSGMSIWQANPTDANTIAVVAEQWAMAPIAGAPWLPEVTPESVSTIAESLSNAEVAILDALETREYVSVGLAECCRVRVTGPSGSGRTSLLRRIAEVAECAGIPVNWVSDADPADAWEVITAHHKIGALLIDNLDDLLTSLDPEYRHALIGSLREWTKTRGTVVVVSARGGCTTDDVFPSHIELQSGGRLRMSGLRGCGVPTDWCIPQPTLAPTWVPKELSMVIVGNPYAIEGFRRQPGWHVVSLPLHPTDVESMRARVPHGTPMLVVGTPDQWLTHRVEAFAGGQDVGVLVLDGNPSDLRLVTRLRALPPLIGAGDAWSIVDGHPPTRVRIDLERRDR